VADIGAAKDGGRHGYDANSTPARRIATDLTEGASYADGAASVLTGRQMWSDHFAMIFRAHYPKPASSWVRGAPAETARFGSDSPVNGRASLTPFGLWGRTCGAVLNEVRRVLIVLSKLVVNGAFAPMPDYSRSYEKQYKGRGPQGDEAHHTT